MCQSLAGINARPILRMRDHVAPLASDRPETSDDELATTMLHQDVAIGQVPRDHPSASPAPDQDTSPRQDIHKQIILLHIDTITYLYVTTEKTE